MLNLMRNYGIIRVVALALVLLALGCLAAACASGGGISINQRAQSFVGGALSNFGGIDGASTTARSIARDIAIAREFDFIQPGFSISPGTITATTAAASQSFGEGTGLLQVAGDQATAELTVSSRDAQVSDATLTGSFSLSQAQAAVSDAGRSFTVIWEFEFSNGGLPVSISAEQTLSGTNWATI
jgi:hypothetical protein